MHTSTRTRLLIVGLISALFVSFNVPAAQATSQSSRAGTSLGSVYFQSGSAKLTSAARITLWRHLAKVKTAATVNVVGYVQRSGSAANDLSLSSARAKVVIAFFKNRGASATFTAKAGRVPVALGTAASARRAEIVITSFKTSVKPTPKPTPSASSTPTPTPTPTPTETFEMSGVIAVNLPAETYTCATAFNVAEIVLSKSGGSDYFATIGAFVDVNGDGSRCEAAWSAASLPAGSYSIAQDLECDPEICDLFTVNAAWGQDAATYDNTLLSESDIVVSADVTGVDTELTLPSPTKGTVSTLLTAESLNYALGSSNPNACSSAGAMIILTPASGGDPIIGTTSNGAGKPAVGGLYYDCTFTLEIKDVPVGNYSAKLVLGEGSGYVGDMSSESSDVTLEKVASYELNITYVAEVTVSAGATSTLPSVTVYLLT